MPFLFQWLAHNQFRRSSKRETFTSKQQKKISDEKRKFLIQPQKKMCITCKWSVKKRKRKFNVNFSREICVHAMKTFYGSFFFSPKSNIFVTTVACPRPHRKQRCMTFFIIFYFLWHYFVGGGTFLCVAKTKKKEIFY